MKKLAIIFGFILIISSFSISAQESFKINKGWNLISPGIFDNLVDQYGTSIKDPLISNIKGVYYFNPIDKTYISSNIYNHPNLGAGFPRNEEYPKKLEELQDDLYLKTRFGYSNLFSEYGIGGEDEKKSTFLELYIYGLQSFWIYSDKEWNLDLPGNGKHSIWAEEIFNRYSPLFEDAAMLFDGWNLISLNFLMIGKSFEEFKGNCEINSLYFFQPEQQKWIKISVSEKIDDEDFLGRGFAIKVSDNCNFDFTGGISPPPSLPN